MKLIFLVLLLANMGCTTNSRLDSSLKNISREVNEGSVTEKYEDGQHNLLVIKRQPVDISVDRNRYFDVPINYLKSLYEPIQEPYFGSAPKQETCYLSKQFDKGRTSEKNYEYVNYKLLTSNNYSYGFCQMPTNGFMSEMTFIYCEKEKIFVQVKYFYKSEKNVKIFNPTMFCNTEKN